MIFFILVLAGFVLLLSSGYCLVRLIINLSLMSKVSLVFLSSVVIAIGTSLPELAISTVSVLHNEDGIALGNVLGSNIFNTLIILGCCLLVNPIFMQRETLWTIQTYFCFIIYLWIWILLFPLQNMFGIISLILFSIFLYKNYLKSKKHLSLCEKETRALSRGLSKKILFFEILKIAVCLFFLLTGAHYIIIGIRKIITLIGLSSLFVSSLFIGMGTSLPELTTCLFASINKKSEIILGSVIGSNIFNILGVLGVSVLISGHPLEVPVDIFLYYLPMILGSLIGFIIFLNAKRIFSLLGGIFLLATYVLFFFFLMLQERAFFFDNPFYFILGYVGLFLIGIFFRKRFCTLDAG